MRIYGSRQVGPGQRPTPSLGRVQDTTAPFARGVSDLGRGVAQGAAQIDAALQRRQEAENNLEYQKLINEAYAADREGRRRLSQLLGVNAAGQSGLATQEFSQRLAEIRDSATNDQVRKAFELRMARFQTDFTDFAERHEQQESARATSAQSKFELGQALEAAADPSNTFADVQKALDVPWRIPGGEDEHGNPIFVPGAAASELMRMGVTGEVLERSRRDHFAQGNAAAVRARIEAKRFDDAESFLKQAEQAGLIDQKSARELGAKIEEYRFDHVAETRLEAILEETRNALGPTARGDERFIRPDMVEAKISNISDPKLRDAVGRKWKAVKPIADSERQLFSAQHWRTAFDQGYRADGSWSRHRLGQEGQEALAWLERNDREKYEKLLAKEAAWRRAQEKELKADRKAAEDRLRREERIASQDALAQARLDMFNDPESFIYDPENEDSLALIVEPYEADLTVEDRGRLLNEVVKFNKPNAQDFMRRVRSWADSLSIDADSDERRTIVGTVLNKYSIWESQDANRGKTPPEDLIQSWQAQAMIEAGLSAPTSPDRGPSPVRTALSVAFSTAMRLHPFALIAGNAEEATQIQLDEPAPEELLVVDPVTGETDPYREEAVRIAKERGLPLTERTIRTLLGDD